MEGYIGEVRAFPYAATMQGRWPLGWLLCDGTEVPVQQYQALYSVIANLYGGTGPNTFKLPDLQAQAIVGYGAGSGLTPRNWSQKTGTAAVTLTYAQLAPHTHALQIYEPTSATTATTTSAPSASGGSQLMRPLSLKTPPPNIGVQVFGAPIAPVTQLSPHTLSPSGGNAAGLVDAHENRQPYLTMAYFICWNGIYPVQE